jgi:hypothetical protein
MLNLEITSLESLSILASHDGVGVGGSPHSELMDVTVEDGGDDVEYPDEYAPLSS